VASKIAPAAPLTDKQIANLCYYNQLNVTFEALLGDASWVTVDWLEKCDADSIALVLAKLTLQFPNDRIRVMDQTTGRMIDFI